VVREFLHDAKDPAAGVDRGRLDFEDVKRIDSWIDVASFVDSDELSFDENGWLWMLDLR
jgi:hypothetical protein